MARMRHPLGILESDLSLGQCGHRQLDRVDEARCVARRRRLAPPLGERKTRVAVEIDDEDIVLHDENLSEAEVAMMTNVRPADVGWQ